MRRPASLRCWRRRRADAQATLYGGGGEKQTCRLADALRTAMTKLRKTANADADAELRRLVWAAASNAVKAVRRRARRRGGAADGGGAGRNGRKSGLAAALTRRSWSASIATRSAAAAAAAAGRRVDERAAAQRLELAAIVVDKHQPNQYQIVDLVREPACCCFALFLEAGVGHRSCLSSAVRRSVHR